MLVESSALVLVFSHQAEKEPKPQQILDLDQFLQMFTDNICISSNRELLRCKLGKFNLQCNAM